MADLYERIHQTTTDFLDSYNQDKVSKDIKALSATLTLDCKRYYLPISIVSYAPALAAGSTNEQYEAQMQPEFSEVWDHWHSEVKDIVVDVRARKSVSDMITYMTTKKGKKYEFEMVFKLQLTDDGTKVSKVEEFVDTALAGQVIADNQAIQEALQLK
ncbi:hypothetical protein LTR97_000988 [Elasticomyces elasticus]|uniref:Uncharacterized protein n=1 Tax=Elasticomyces elasticus TaxID=574655 RepID=A0AAN7WFP7_9PEZI|nr:hypothetical protein LTR97_000988 [Elasticomyces elasticus]